MSPHRKQLVKPNSPRTYLVKGVNPLTKKTETLKALKLDLNTGRILHPDLLNLRESAAKQLKEERKRLMERDARTFHATNGKAHVRIFVRNQAARSLVIPHRIDEIRVRGREGANYYLPGSEFEKTRAYRRKLKDEQTAKQGK